MIAISLILSLTTGFASPVVGSLPAAAVATRAPSDVSLRIDHTALLEHESATVVDHTVFFVREDVTKALGRDHGVTLVEDPGAAAILVTLSWVSYEDSTYGVTLETQRPGEARRLLERFECECINSGLASAVVERLPAALERLEPPRTTPPGPAVEGPATARDDEPSGRRPLGVKGKAGVGLLAAGVAGTIAGGVVFAQRRRATVDDTEHEVWSGRDFQPPGVALMVTGGVVAVAGAVLLVIDRVQARRSRDAGTTRARSSRLMPTRGGVNFTLRF